VEGIGLETVGVEANPHGVQVDQCLRASERLWAIGGVNGIWPLTHVGEFLPGSLHYGGRVEWSCPSWIRVGVSSRRLLMAD
jgi:hypothetical protein